MNPHIINKMQALPASFFNLCGIAILVITLLSAQMVFSLLNYGDMRLSLSDNLVRVQLVKQVVRAPQSIKFMDNEKIAILLREPTLKRNERLVTAWHYHGESCALDIYFSNTTYPDYIEYRALTLNEDVQAQFDTADNRMMDNYCLKDVLETQGVDTPASYARQPVPTWDNPYRS